jgi:hypothetical protein
MKIYNNVEELPDEETLTENFRIFLYYYRKFIEGDCEPNKEELINISKVLSKLDKLNLIMKDIYDEH